jgi:hypothetical protein
LLKRSSLLEENTNLPVKSIDMVLNLTIPYFHHSNC